MDNPNLAICEVASVCELLAQPNDAFIQIENNAPGCNSQLEVSSACGLEVNLVSGVVQFDFDANACDPNDLGASNVMVQVTNGIDNYNTITNSAGNFERLINFEGTVTTTALLCG